jgi:hypothetical protein
MNFKSIPLLISLMLMATSSVAADYPKPIQSAVNASVKVVTEFTAPAGMKGWVMQQGSQYSIVWPPVLLNAAS